MSYHHQTVKPYDWLYSKKGALVDELIAVKDEIREMADTSATFAATDIDRGISHRRLRDPMFEVHGAWRLPDRYTQYGGRRYVNPNYIHREIYADITGRCECGAVITHVTNGQWEGRINHEDDCPEEMREQTVVRLHKNRMDWLSKGANLWLSTSDVAARMAVSPRYVRMFCEENGCDWQEMRAFGRARMGASWRKLYDDGYSYGKIADAFAVSEATVKTYACNVEDMTPENKRLEI